MPVFRLLFILFLTIPLAELYILIQVGGLVGAIPTIALCILTAIIGAVLLRYQGLQTIIRVQSKLSRGELPAVDMLEGAILLISGALLLTPGFFTDGIGFLCLVPKARTWMALSFLKQLLQRHTFHTSQGSVTLDGEYWEEQHKRIKD